MISGTVLLGLIRLQIFYRLLEVTWIFMTSQPIVVHFANLSCFLHIHSISFHSILFQSLWLNTIYLVTPSFHDILRILDFFQKDAHLFLTFSFRLHLFTFSSPKAFSSSPSHLDQGLTTSHLRSGLFSKNFLATLILSITITYCDNQIVVLTISDIRSQIL
jgi:hypothetical protein